MSELELLKQSEVFYSYLSFSSLIPLCIVGGLAIFDKLGNNAWLTTVIAFLIAFTIFGVSIGLSWGLDEKIQQLEHDQYIVMSCDQLRENIVTQLQTNNSTNITFQKDYYYHNCEVPLRDEVLKLHD